MFQQSEYRSSVEAQEGWRTISIPELEFPCGWKVKLVPPYTGAMARFCATNTHGAQISVYFDAMDALGVVGQPYWEIYPIKGDSLADAKDTQRFICGEEDAMIAAIAVIGDPVEAAKWALTYGKKRE